MSATGKAARYPRSFNVLWRDGLPGLPVVVGLSGPIGEIVRDSDEAVFTGFEVLRTGSRGPSCSVNWRVEGTGSNPVLPEHFLGGVLPEGVASFASGVLVVPVTLALSAGAPPPSVLSGRVVLFDPVGARIAVGYAELPFTIAAAVIGDEAVVGLDVPFATLGPSDAPASVMRLTLDATPSSGKPYSSGELQTLATAHYGSYRCRMKPAKGSGLISSFFTYALSGNAEIDVEFLGKDTTKVEFNYYTNGVGDHETVHDLGYDASVEFHEYGFDWAPGSVTWFLDGVAVHTETGARGPLPTEASPIFINLWAVNSSGSAWAGPFSYTAPVWADYDSIIGPALSEGFDTFNSAVWVKSDNRANGGAFNVGWKADHAQIVASSTGIYTFSVRRSGDTTVPCSVAWALEGTGLSPITGASFAGGVLPAGTVSFAADELVRPASFELTATVPPAVTQTGQIILRSPVDCLINPASQVRIVTIPGGSPPLSEWDFTAANMAVHPAPGQASRVTFSAGQVEVAGAANADDLNVALWFKALPFQNYEIIFEYLKNEDTPAADAGGRFAQFWGAMLGTTTKPADVTTWSPAQYGNVSDADYGDYSRSWRISYDTESTDTDNANEARLVVYDEGTETRPVATPGPNFWLEGENASYRITVRREGESLTIAKVPEESTAAVQWADPGVAQLGRIGWRFGRGRGAILRAVPGVPFIRELTGTVTPQGDLWTPIPLAAIPIGDRTDVTSLGSRAGSPGQHFVLTGDVTGAILTLTGTGTKGREIVFRGDSDSSSATGLRVLTNCTINLNGSYCCLGRLVLRNCVVKFNGDHCSVARCDLTDYQPTSRQNALFEGSGTYAQIAYNDVTDRLGDMRSCMVIDHRAPNWQFAYNLFENCKVVAGSNTYLWYMGESSNTTNIQLLCKIHHNLMLRCEMSDIIEIKTSDVSFTDNTVESCGASGIRIRHGRRHIIQRNLFVAAGNGALVTVRTGPHTITENQLKTGSGAAGAGTIRLYAGNLHWDYAKWSLEHDPGAGNNWQAAGECRVLGNLAGIVVGEPSCNASTCYKYNATDNNVGPTSGPSRNRAVTLKYEQGTKRLAESGYDIERLLPRMERASIGLRTP